MTDDFFKYQAQTTPYPIALEIAHAKGSYIYDTNNKAYLDFVAGVSACPLGHNHPKVIEAIKAQLEKHLHVMVYGEYVQKSPVLLAKELAKNLPPPLEKTYLTNSGTEAIEGAIKLAKRATGRSEIISAHKSYHGNTMGAMSIMGFEARKQAFRPLIPGTRLIHFNALEDLSLITTKTAAIVLETIQGGAGFICPQKDYLKAVKARCQETGTLLILDEIQPGMGRTGRLFCFEHYGCVPDILVSGKGLGGGMPIGAFTAAASLMDLLCQNPKLGHITTFGGHPLVAAAALATLQEITQSNIMQNITEKETQIRQLLVHPSIVEIRGMGLMLALILPSETLVDQLIAEVQKRGLILFRLLFEPCAVRITPPLTISEEELTKGCQIIMASLRSFETDIQLS